MAVISSGASVDDQSKRVHKGGRSCQDSGDISRHPAGLGRDREDSYAQEPDKWLPVVQAERP